jgi:hypothetical protein
MKKKLFTKVIHIFDVKKPEKWTYTRNYPHYPQKCSFFSRIKKNECFVIVYKKLHKGKKKLTFESSDVYGKIPNLIQIIDTCFQKCQTTYQPKRKNVKNDENHRMRYSIFRAFILICSMDIVNLSENQGTELFIVYN